MDDVRPIATAEPSAKPPFEQECHHIFTHGLAHNR